MIRFKWLTENWGLKLISFLLAIGFWFYVQGEERIEVTKTVPLSVDVLSEKLGVVKTSAQFLDVTFQAPRNLYSVLMSSEITAHHAIQGVEKAGDYSFNATASDFELPAPEIRVARVIPSLITVTLDEIIVKKLLVEADLAGEPAYGYQVDENSIELDPNAVLAEGPKALLEQMDAIKTDPLQLTGRVRSFRRSVDIKRNPEIRVIGDAATHVYIPINAVFAEKEFPEVAVKPLGTPAPKYVAQLEREQVSITLKGPRAILDKLEAEELLVYVDVDGLKEGAHEIRAELILPPDVSLKGSPPAISVQVLKAKF